MAMTMAMTIIMIMATLKLSVFVIGNEHSGVLDYNSSKVAVMATIIVPDEKKKPMI